MSWLTLCWIAFWLAIIPYFLGIWNLFLFRPPKVVEGDVAPVSILVPARNEEARIRPALETIQETEGVDFELIVADDGSGPETAELLKEMQSKVDYHINHVWQEDDGFQKCRILNKAIIACKNNQGIFVKS